MNEPAKSIIDVHLIEFDKIKAEQFGRIGFRDNLVYITLVAYGAIGSFAIQDNHLALLILPWVSLILGWNYLVNDEKVSAIGRYVRHQLAAKIASNLGASRDDILGWEVEHRSDSRRFRRKVEQLIIDEVIFVFSGIAAVIGFWFMDSDANIGLRIISALELLMLCALGIEIIVYADWKSGR
jgi:hypothetical protein